MLHRLVTELVPRDLSDSLEETDAELKKISLETIYGEKVDFTPTRRIIDKYFTWIGIVHASKSGKFIDGQEALLVLKPNIVVPGFQSSLVTNEITDTKN